MVNRVANSLHEAHIYSDHLLLQVKCLTNGMLVCVVAMLAEMYLSRPELRIKCLAILVKHKRTPIIFPANFNNSRSQSQDHILGVCEVEHVDVHLFAPLATLLATILMSQDTLIEQLFVGA
eukprot:CAMPEP_0179156662 /NCGR_PEP_ID=MMETSP0796-20121207/76380_1 /TAXON_ID=73915 /ORGANISM="Pyrodinium bahamense, Strain pbaha01" /LENGTH=120 /DNA_ID=CAMNT_0020858249 /DNA_START=337 /DNA_END=695 /DNA_ORIENTATION=+